MRTKAEPPHKAVQRQRVLSMRRLGPARSRQQM